MERGGERIGIPGSGDVAVLAVLGEAAEDVIELAGPENLAGTLVLDATNPLDFSGGMPPGLLFGGTDSLGERVQATLPEASVVECFNAVSNAQMVDPSFEEGTPPMLVRTTPRRRSGPRRSSSNWAGPACSTSAGLPRGARAAVGDRRREARHLGTRVHGGRVSAASR